jgi:hypothetical protein
MKLRTFDNDTENQTISPFVIIGTPTTTINSAAGGLTFAGILLNSNRITSTGAGSMSMNSLNGNGILTENGDWRAAAAPGAPAARLRSIPPGPSTLTVAPSP